MKVRKRATPKNRKRGFEGDSRGMRVLLGEFVEALAAKNFSPDTIRTRRSSLFAFLDWCDERSLVEPTEVTLPILERYQRWLYYFRQADGRPLSFRAQHHRLVSVKVFFRWLTKTHRTLFNPASELELPKLGQSLPRDILTFEEAAQVLNQPDVQEPIGIRDRSILEVLYSTGIRRKELASLKIYDLALDAGTLRVTQGKGHKDRIVPIGARALAWTETYITQVRPQWAVEPDEGYLFLRPDGDSFKRISSLTEMAHRYLRQAGITKRGGCHIFRHTMATLMLENGADIRYIQEMLGHADLGTTQVYTRVSIQKLKEVHQMTHPAEKTWTDPRDASSDARTAAAQLLDALAVEADEEDAAGDA